MSASKPRKRRRRPERDRHEVGWELGERMYVRGVTLHGAGATFFSEVMWRQFLIEVAKALNMTPVAKAASWEFPLHGGGGKGRTIVQPITESFLVLDTWPDHGGAYLFICSCQPFGAKCMRGVLERFGLSEGRAIGAPTKMLRLL